MTKKDYSDLLYYCTENAEDEKTGCAKDHIIKSFFSNWFPKEYRCESAANNSDGYIFNRIIFEFKAAYEQWFAGFFQAIAYTKELPCQLIVVIAHQFIGVWDLESINKDLITETKTIDESPCKIGQKQALKYKKIKAEILGNSIWNTAKDTWVFDPIYKNDPQQIQFLDQFKDILLKGKIHRIPITTKNFPNTIKEMARFFRTTKRLTPVRSFYSMLSCWTENSYISFTDRNEFEAIIYDPISQKHEPITDLIPETKHNFKHFVNQRYIHLESGENIDDFYSHFDKAIDVIDKEFRIQHGIYFTDSYLARFALWCVKQYIPHLGEEYLVIDPACGSGNLVSSWKTPLLLRHKVISEIEPELLYAVEKRMENDSYHLGKVTAIPKDHSNGLNFIDKSAEEYLSIIKDCLSGKDDCTKPIAFLCNPPYRNDDDKNKANRINTKIDPQISVVIGEDASSERLCCFLAQMKRICELLETGQRHDDSFVLVFTPTNWLNNTPVYQKLRKEFLSNFRDEFGFIVNSREFFDVPGKFPIAFIIWRYIGNNSLDSNRPIILHDFTALNREFLKNSFNTNYEEIFIDYVNKNLKVPFGIQSQTIKNWIGIPMFDFKRDRRKNEIQLSGGLPLGSALYNNKKAYGESTGNRIGFMDELTPCRINKGEINIPWFRLNNKFFEINRARCLSGPPDHIGYYANNYELASKTFFWYALSCVFETYRYPLWTNNAELWAPNIPDHLQNKIDKFSFSIGFADNECVTTIFPANNPIHDVKEITIKNPLCPTDPDSFWSKTMAAIFNPEPKDITDKLVLEVKKLFSIWNTLFITQSRIIAPYDKPYFVDNNRYLYRNSGILQIEHYAKAVDHKELLAQINKISDVLKETKREFYRIIKEDLNYFEQIVSTQNPISESQTNIYETRLQLAVLIVNHYAISDPNFGRTKLVKSFYLIEHIIQKDLQTQYYRDAAGPLDVKLLYNKQHGIEALAEKMNVFSIVQHASIKYIAEDNLKEYYLKAKRNFKLHWVRIMNLLELFLPLKTDQMEIIATLYAIWNDFIIKGQLYDDTKIIQEYYQWHTNKKKQPVKRLQKALNWMRDNYIIPSGFGRATKSVNPII